MNFLYYYLVERDLNPIYEDDLEIRCHLGWFMLFGLCVCTMIVVSVHILGAWHMQQFSQTQGIVIRWLIIELTLHFIYWFHHVWTKFINYFTTLCPIRLWSWLFGVKGPLHLKWNNLCVCFHMCDLVRWQSCSTQKITKPN